MPAPSKPTQARRRALGDGVSKLTKPDYSPELQLNDDHPCAPSFPPVFTPTNADLWSDCWAAETLTPLKRHGSPVAGERPPQKRQPITNAFKETAPGISHGELNRLSQRAYSLRASDASDFASAWETSIVPLLHGILQQHYIGDFAIDVHNFPGTRGSLAFCHLRVLEAPCGFRTVTSPPELPSVPPTGWMTDIVEQKCRATPCRG